MPTTDRRRSSRRSSAPSAAARRLRAGRQPSRASRTQGQAGNRADDPAPIIPILARRVREVEAKSLEGKVGPAKRTKFQVIALLVREERARIKADASISPGARSELLKRLDGVATILAKAAAHDTTLLRLLDDSAVPGPAAQRMRLDWLLESGAELAPEDLVIAATTPSRGPAVSAELAAKQVMPRSVPARVRANPFLAPDLTRPRDEDYTPGLLARWDLMDPLYRAFEQGAGGGAASMTLPPMPRIDRYSPVGYDLMPHQIRMLEAVRQGHRTFLLADEPGLGKTAQSVLAASVAGAYPMLAVVPNVVKINWAREVQRWTPRRRVTVIHGDGVDVDAFADVFVVNYTVLDRHLSWLSSFGFRSMVVDEAHFIKNLTSQRSQHVLALGERIRENTPGGDPLLLALTGTPLINDVEDFNAIWRFLGWVKNGRPGPELMRRLEESGLTPADRGFYPQARTSVIEMGIVRRRKVDVAKDLPDKRIADIPVELDDEAARSIRAVRARARTASARAATAGCSRPARPSGAPGGRGWTVSWPSPRRPRSRSTKSSCAGYACRSWSRRRAPAGAARTSSPWSAGSVRPRRRSRRTTPPSWPVRWARSSSSPSTSTSWTPPSASCARPSCGPSPSAATRASRSASYAIDAFQKDPDVSVAVCSLMAAGVGLNLHAASNVVLAELSWTAAEQQQAIDRVHRIGQDEPVTAWRILAAQTIDGRIAELIDSKQGLAARALDGSDEEVGSGDSVQLDALVHLLRQALTGR